MLDKAGIRKRCVSTVQSSGMSSWAVSVGIVAVLASVVDAWICDITLIGNSTEPQSLTFSKAAVNCTRDDRDSTPTLQVRIHPFLQSATLEGVDVELELPDDNQQLLCFQQDNILFHNVQLFNVDAFNMLYILGIYGSNNTFEGLQSIACNARNATMYIRDGGNGINTATDITRSTFTSSPTRALHVANSNVTITESVFDGLSTVTQNGAAILSESEVDTYVVIANCSFNNNAATGGHAGALWHAGPHLSLQNTTFQNNTSVINGGAVYIESRRLADGSWADGEGVSVVACSFKNNTSKLNGGALYYDGSYGQNKEELFVRGTVFDGNNGSSGGALSTWGLSRLYLNESTVKQNIAFFGRGGGIYTYGNIQRRTDVFIWNSRFLGNNATNMLTNSPGGIFDVGECAGAHLSSCNCVGIYNTTFEENIGIGLCLRDVSGRCEGAFTEGGFTAPLFRRQTITTEDQRGTFEDFLGQDVSINFAVDVRQCAFRGNTAASQVRSNDDPVQPQDPLAGAAALDLLSIPYSVLADLVFENNVGRQGSAVHLDSCTATIMWNNTFAGNIATHEGGAIAIVNSHGKGILMGASKLHDNVALAGGALYGGSGSSIVVTNHTILSNNSALTHGGAVSCSGCQALTMQVGSSAQLNQAQLFGGACYCIECNTFYLHDVNVSANSAGSGGALYIDGSTEASVTLTNITHTLLKNNRAAQAASGEDGGAIYLAGGITTTYNTTFADNHANRYGGAIAYRHQCFDFASLPGEMRSVTYLWEGASSQTHQIAALAGQCSVLKSNSDSFLNNFAVVGGGAIHATNMTSLMLLCNGAAAASSIVACNNWAGNGVQEQSQGNRTRLQGYGPDLAFVPATINISPSEVAQYASNGNSKLPMTIQVRDQAGSPILSALSLSLPLRAVVEASALLPNQPNPQLQGQTQATAQPNGTISISELSLLAKPGSYNVSVPLPDYPLVSAASMVVSVRECVVGEIKPKPEICTACSAPTFSFASNNELCDACPANANCTGGAVVVPNLQYWHSAPNSDFMVQCPNREACEGNREELRSCKQQALLAEHDPTLAQGSCNLTAGMDSTDSNAYMVKQCQEGYHGPVCSLCLKGGGPNGTRYGRTGISQCQECRRSGVILIAYTISTLLVICWLLFTTHVTLQENREDAAGMATPGSTSEYIRALTLWLQYTMLLGNINISAPKPVISVFHAASFAFSAVTSGVLSTDCLLSGAPNPAILRVVIHLAVPVMVLLFLLIGQILWWWTRAKHPSTADPISSPIISSGSMSSTATELMAATNQPHTAPLLSSSHAELRRRLLVTFLTVIFYYYPSLLTTSLSLFACYRIDPIAAQMGQSYPQNAQANWRWGYWVPDMTVRCYHGWHLGFSAGLGVPLLLLVAVAIPFLPIFLLFKYNTQLKETSVKIRLGFLYHSYRAHFWFWDSIILLQTLTLAAAEVFATSLNAYIQLTIMLMVLVIGMAGLAYYHPFEDPGAQGTQVLGLLVVVATATGCLYFLDPDEVASHAGLNAAGILLLIVNFGFAVLMAALISKRGRPTALKWLAWLRGTSSKAAQKLNSLLHLPWARHGSISQCYSGPPSASTSGSSVQLGLLPTNFQHSNTSASSDVGLSMLRSGS